MNWNGMTVFSKFTHIFIINLTIACASSMCGFLLKEGVYDSSGKVVHLLHKYLLGDVLGWIAGNGVWCWEVCWQVHSASTSMGDWGLERGRIELWCIYSRGVSQSCGELWSYIGTWEFVLSLKQGFLLPCVGQGSDAALSGAVIVSSQYSCNLGEGEPCFWKGVWLWIWVVPWHIYFSCPLRFWLWLTGGTVMSKSKHAYSVLLRSF